MESCGKPTRPVRLGCAKILPLHPNRFALRPGKAPDKQKFPSSRLRTPGIQHPQSRTRPGLPGGAAASLPWKKLPGAPRLRGLDALPWRCFGRPAGPVVDVVDKGGNLVQSYGCHARNAIIASLYKLGELPPGPTDPSAGGRPRGKRRPIRSAHYASQRGTNEGIVFAGESAQRPPDRGQGRG